MYTDAPNKRCFSWSNDVPQLRAGLICLDATNLVETLCYLFGRNNCSRKQYTLKAVVKVSRNTELYSCQTTHLKPKNSYQFSKSITDSYQRLNWTVDHVNATCAVNVKTRLRYEQTPSHLNYTVQPRGPCGRTAFISLAAIIPGGVLSSKRLIMGMCRWMGSHFHNGIDYNGVKFLVELLEWGRTFSEFLG